MLTCESFILAVVVVLLLHMLRKFTWCARAHRQIHWIGWTKTYFSLAQFHVHNFCSRCFSYTTLFSMLLFLHVLNGCCCFVVSTFSPINIAYGWHRLYCTNKCEHQIDYIYSATAPHRLFFGEKLLLLWSMFTGRNTAKKQHNAHTHNNHHGLSREWNARVCGGSVCVRWWIE